MMFPPGVIVQGATLTNSGELEDDDVGYVTWSWIVSKPTKLRTSDVYSEVRHANL